MKAKIGSKEVDVEIEERYGLELYHSKHGTAIHFAGKRVGYISPYSQEWLEYVSQKDLYIEIWSQQPDRNYMEDDEYFLFMELLKSGDTLDAAEFYKRLDKERLMEELK